MMFPKCAWPLDVAAANERYDEFRALFLAALRETTKNVTTSKPNSKGWVEGVTHEMAMRAQQLAYLSLGIEFEMIGSLSYDYRIAFYPAEEVPDVVFAQKDVWLLRRSAGLK